MPLGFEDSPNGQELLGVPTCMMDLAQPVLKFLAQSVSGRLSTCAVSSLQLGNIWGSQMLTQDN